MRNRVGRFDIPWQAERIETVRVDQWLWSVRITKTRSDAAAACRGGHVKVNGTSAKPSTPVKVGDRVEAFVHGRERVLEVGPGVTGLKEGDRVATKFI